MKVKDVIKLALGILVIGMMLPCTEIDKLIFKGGELVKVIWFDGSVSKLKGREWIYNKKE